MSTLNTAIRSVFDRLTSDMAPHDQVRLNCRKLHTFNSMNKNYFKTFKDIYLPIEPFYNQLNKTPENTCSQQRKIVSPKQNLLEQATCEALIAK